MAIYQDDTLVKRANKKVNYTQEQIEELTKCMDPETGPLYFIEKFVKVQHPTLGSKIIELYPYQRDLLDLYHNNRKSVAMCSRQMGKSTIAAAYLLWYAMFNDDATILIASNKHEGALEIMHRIRYAYESIPDHIRAGVTAYNKKSLGFDNSSRIFATATTENTGRGLSISLVYLDELAAVEPNIARPLWTSLSPTLSTGGKIIITSTPNLETDQFADIWFDSLKTLDEHGNDTGVSKNEFKSYKAIWSDHPDRDEKWAEAERSALGEAMFLREHCCEFVTFEETLINPIKLNHIKPIDPISRTGHVRWYSKINPRATYVISLDPSLGTGGDNAAIQVVELQTLTQVAEWCDNNTPIEDQIRIMRDIMIEIDRQGDPEIYWSMENNTVGEAGLVVIRSTGEEMFPGTMISEPRKTAGRKRGGFYTSERSKYECCARLKHLVETGKMKINSKALVGELRTFIAAGNSFKAKSGQSDDLVLSILLAIRIIDFVALWDESTEDVLSVKITNDDDEYDEPMPFFL